MREKDGMEKELVQVNISNCWSVLVISDSRAGS